MNPFARRAVGANWLVPISLMTLLLGLMMSAAWITTDTRDKRLSTMAPDQRTRIATGSIDVQTEYSKLLAEVTKLRNENTKLQNSFSDTTEQTKVLNESLQETKKFAALTEVEGAGLVISLMDDTSERIDAPVDATIIHDIDVLRVVNELWNAGSEAIAVNGHRVGPRSSFRCVGSVILVDNVQIASPVIVEAIGNADTLLGAMKLPGGILQELRTTSSNMVKIELAKKLRLTAYAGSTSTRQLTVPEIDK
ncbi:MAG: hypothetical protein HONBIEJF_00646 [Fimbriimonadaceae bacterium]|nr:hypothetical protein [Fimbriimonadaceae bacterium]